MQSSPNRGSFSRVLAHSLNEAIVIDTAILALIAQYGLPLVVLIVFGRELGVPTGIPMIVLLLLTGAYAIHSIPMLIIGVLLIATAEFLGTTSLHLIMRTGGARVMNRLLRRHREKAEQSITRWQSRLASRDTTIVLAGRLTPMLRTYTTIGTGLLRIRLRSFLSGAAVAALIWTGTPLVVGYVVREDVQALQARYSSLSHLIFAIMPAAVLCAGLVLWARTGHSFSACLRRFRSALGFVAALVTTGYLISVIWRSDWTLDQGAGSLTGWLSLLAGLAFILLTFAYGDFRASSPQWHRRGLGNRGQVIATEMVSTTAWLTTLVAIGFTAARIGLHYPAL